MAGEKEGGWERGSREAGRGLDRKYSLYRSMIIIYQCTCAIRDNQEQTLEIEWQC